MHGMGVVDLLEQVCCFMGVVVLFLGGKCGLKQVCCGWDWLFRGGSCRSLPFGVMGCCGWF